MTAGITIYSIFNLCFHTGLGLAIEQTSDEFSEGHILFSVENLCLLKLDELHLS